jgi:hypothetical protein
MSKTIDVEIEALRIIIETLENLLATEGYDNLDIERIINYLRSRYL